MDWNAFNQNFEDAALVFVYDERRSNQEKLCSLRKLPALLRLGFAITTHPKSWRKLDQWSTNQFEFENPTFITLDDLPDEPTSDLVAITDQYYEDEYPIFSLGRVLNAYTRVDHRLIVASDDADFEPAGGRRPLAESPTIDKTFDYRRIFDAFKTRYRHAGLHFPLQDSQNIYLQDNAIIYELVTGESLHSITDVFYRLPDAPYLPLWQTISEIFTMNVPQGTRLLDQNSQEGLAKWLRRRVELGYESGQEIASYLNHLARRHEQLFNPYRRTRRPEMREARERIEEVTIQDPTINTRYRNWLMEKRV